MCDVREREVLDRVRKKVISILEDIEPWALDDTGLHIPDTQIEKAAEKIMCILTDAGFRIVGPDEAREADLRDFVGGIEDPVLRRLAEDKLSRALEGGKA